MENSHIEWTHHTFNPWRGCTKVSAGCANCYAEARSRINPKVLGEWGKDGTRAIAAESYWKLPFRWNREAQASGVRYRVFCASLADVWEDRDDLLPHRARLLRTVMNTPHLDWLLLTKRPQNITPLLVKGGFAASLFRLPSFWHTSLGVSVEDQPNAELRIPQLLDVPCWSRFLSCEPLLGELTLAKWLEISTNATTGDVEPSGWRPGLHWVILGGESGADARPCNTDWVRGVTRECVAARVPVFVKQLGHRPVAGASDERFVMSLNDTRKGGDVSEFPPDLQIREFPGERVRSEQ